MFEITPDDIKALNDEDLRTLVALLCEAHVRVRGHPTTSVTYGGDQTAKDGGLDVRVTLPESANMDGFVSRPNTGFQVKKPNMARAGILKEMRPSGKLRAVIKSLISAKGAYIIASSGTSASDSSLQDRLDAMPEALKGAPNAKDLHTDFYDRTRLATEVRNHGGMVLWARQKIGKSVPGWQPFGAWANPAEGADSEYLLDDKLRIQMGKKEEQGGLKAEDGLNRIRDALRKPGSVALHGQRGARAWKGSAPQIASRGPFFFILFSRFRGA